MSNTVPVPGTTSEILGTEGVLVMGAPTLDGEIWDFERFLMRYRTGMAGCYRHALSRSPDLAGTLELTFVVGADGTALGARLSETDGPWNEVACCLASQVKRWTFAPPEDGAARVTLTLVMRPK